MPSEEPRDPKANPGAEGSALPTRAMDPSETAGTVIGRYHLLQKIGEGGMGEVWLAEQKVPVRRRIALKLVKAGMNTREVIARFESERQALALMDHPAIARVFDAGSTPQGAPYFVMEYIAGVPITTYCDNHRLNTRERLDLFMHVCEGVQHAHQKAIIHRDLKPSNILVTEVDRKPFPKIIDFGVAKALTQKLTADTMFTRVGTMIGTPEYMSPEQALSSGEDIDTRTDVYSLGIILYELLAGVPPIELRNVAFEEFLRRLREDDAAKPSTRVRTQEPATLTEVARRRHTEPQALVKQMRGDLDSIALKALEKDRSRRYGSPSDLGADIGRYLNNEAVLAVPASAAYRVRKFARRHRWGLATACAFALVLMTATVVSVRQSVRANREAVAAQAVSDFLQHDLLAQASATNQAGPSAKPDPDLKVRTALDRAAARVAGKFDKQPELEASIRDTIGATYMDLGLYREARTQLERALDLHRRVLGAANPVTAKTLSRLGTVALFQGKFSEAETLLGQALETQRRVLGSEHPDLLYSMNSLANDYSGQGKYAQAEALYLQTLEIRRRTLGPEHRDTLTSMHNLATVYINLGKYAQSEALFNQTLEIERRALGPEHPTTVFSMNGLATVYRAENKLAQAEVVDEQVLEIDRRVLGPEHRWTLGSTGNLAHDYRLQGKYAQAEPLDRQALEIQARVLGPDDRDTVWSTGNLANDYCAQGKYAEAEALLRRAVESSPKNPYFLSRLAWYLVTAADRRQRRPAEALQFAREAEKVAPDCAECYESLGLAAYRNDRWDEAIATLNQAAAADKGTDPEEFFFLAMAYWRRGDKGEAERFFQKGVEGASKIAEGDMDLRMFWGEAAELLGKPGPAPTLLEAQAEPQRVMETLKSGILSGRFQVADLQSNPDLAPLRGRADFQALLRTTQALGKPAH